MPSQIKRRLLSLTMLKETNKRRRDAELESLIERRIHARTWCRVRRLHVEADGEQVVIHGSTQTYYLKQLALEAAREVLGCARVLLVNIHVS
jgi:hypothetical protein